MPASTTCQSLTCTTSLQTITAKRFHKPLAYQRLKLVILSIILLFKLAAILSSQATNDYATARGFVYGQQQQVKDAKIIAKRHLHWLPTTNYSQLLAKEPPARPLSREKLPPPPRFATNMLRNISVERGESANLLCQVYELADLSLSWLRPKTNEILTSGLFVYTNDARISVSNDTSAENGFGVWKLSIKNAQPMDSAAYECQVNTDPTMSVIINLTVKAVRARIKQGEFMNAAMGADVEFTCNSSSLAANNVHQSSLAAAFDELDHNNSQLHTTSLPIQPWLAQQEPKVYWYFNGNLLNFANLHQHVPSSIQSSSSSNLEQQASPNAVALNFSILWDPLLQVSVFRLRNVQFAASGNYTCKPTGAEPATIRLHVRKPKPSATKNQNNRPPKQHITYLPGMAPDPPAGSTSAATSLLNQLDIRLIRHLFGTTAFLLLLLPSSSQL